MTCRRIVAAQYQPEYWAWPRCQRKVRQGRLAASTVADAKRRSASETTPPLSRYFTRTAERSIAVTRSETPSPHSNPTATRITSMGFSVAGERHMADQSATQAPSRLPMRHLHCFPTDAAGSPSSADGDFLCALGHLPDDDGPGSEGKGGEDGGHQNLLGDLAPFVADKTGTEQLVQRSQVGELRHGKLLLSEGQRHSRAGEVPGQLEDSDHDDDDGEGDDRGAENQRLDRHLPSFVIAGLPGVGHESGEVQTDSDEFGHGSLFSIPSEFVNVLRNS